MSNVSPGRLEVDDVSAMLMELEPGPVAYSVTPLATAAVNTVTEYGSDAAAWSEKDGTRLFQQKRGEPSGEEITISPVDTVTDEMAEFARWIRTGEKPGTDPKVAIWGVDLLEAIIESAEPRRPVDVG